MAAAMTVHPSPEAQFEAFLRSQSEDDPVQRGAARLYAELLKLRRRVPELEAALAELRTELAESDKTLRVLVGLDPPPPGRERKAG